MNPTHGEQLDWLQGRIGYRFRKTERLTEALTHKSYLNEIKNLPEGEAGQPVAADNERLEFLGDAVLDLVISEHLLAVHPAHAEGELSKIKSRIVSEPALARAARRLELGRYLLLGRGEEMTQGRDKSSILSDALEAVIAAIYLDGGLEPARLFILNTLEEELTEEAEVSAIRDYKTDLQEWCQREYEVLPVYRVLRETGPDHQKTFEVELTIRGEVYGSGVGRSKKEAEQRAARVALDRIKKSENA
jgi:ribonuclease-3